METTEIQSKPIAEWFKYNFNIQLPRIIQILKSGKYGIKLNGVEIKNPNVKIKNDDIITIDKKEYKVELRENEKQRKVTIKNGQKKPNK